MLGIVALAHKHAVHVGAKRRRGTGPARIEHGNGARVAFGRIQEFLRHAVLQSASHAVAHELRIAAEHFLLVDVRLADRNVEAQLLEKLDDEIRRLKLRPAFLRTLVQLAAVANHFFVILGIVFHDILQKFSSRGLVCRRQGAALQ